MLDFPHKQLRPLFVTKEEFGTIISVKQDKDKRFWLGTSSGLYVYDRTTQKIDTVDTKRFIGITSLAFDTHDRLWVSTHEGLYAYVFQEKRVIVFGESDGVLHVSFTAAGFRELFRGYLYCRCGWRC